MGPTIGLIAASLVLIGLFFNLVMPFASLLGLLPSGFGRLFRIMTSFTWLRPQSEDHLPQSKDYLPQSEGHSVMVC